MTNIRQIKREPSERMLIAADRLEMLVERIRKGEIDSLAFVSLDSKETDSGYVFGHDSFSLLGAVHLLESDLTDIVRSW